MPLVRLELKNEYGLGNRELYRVTEKDDSKTQLEGVAVAGLVGVLRQLADLAEFASQVFHDLHEQMMATTSRSQDMMIRVQQLEEDLPSFEKAALSQTSHLHFAYTEGSDWHASVQIEENHVTRGDLPGFIMHAYEECRGPPCLFLLDKYDVTGGGACLKRYSDPSFFRMEWATMEFMKAEKVKHEMKVLRSKKKLRRQRNGGAADAGPLTRNHNLAFDASSGFDLPIPTGEDISIYSMNSMADRVIGSHSFNSRSKISYMESLLDVSMPSGCRNIEADALTNSISKPPCTTVGTSVISGSPSLTGDEVHHGGAFDADKPEPRASLSLDDDVTSELENYVDALNTTESEGQPDYECSLCRLKQEKECHYAGEEGEIRSGINKQELSNSDVENLSVMNEGFIHVLESKVPRSQPSLRISENETILQDFKIIKETVSSSGADGDAADPAANNKVMAKQSDIQSTISFIGLHETNDFTEESSVFQQLYEHSSISHDYESFYDGSVPIDVIRGIVQKQDDGETADPAHEKTASSSATLMQQRSELESSKCALSPKSHRSDCSSPPLEHMEISFLPINDLDTSTLNPDLPDDLEDSLTSKPIESGTESDDDTFGKPSVSFSEDMLSQEWESNSERWECNQVNGHDNDVRDNLHRNSSANSISCSSVVEETSRQAIGSDSPHEINGEVRYNHTKSRKISAAGSVDLSANSTSSSFRLEETTVHPIGADSPNEFNDIGRYKLPKSRKSSAGSVNFSTNTVSDPLGLEKTSRNSVGHKYLYQVNDTERCNHARPRKSSTAGSVDLSVNSLSSPSELEETSRHLLGHEYLYEAKDAGRSTRSRSRKSSTAGSVDSISSSLGLEETSKQNVESGSLNEIKDEQRNYYSKSKRNSTDGRIDLSGNLISSSLGLVGTVEHPIRQEYPYESMDARRPSHSKSRKSSTAETADLSVDLNFPSFGLEEASMQPIVPDFNEVKETPRHHHSRSGKSSITGSVDPSAYGVQVSQNDCSITGSVDPSAYGVPVSQNDLQENDLAAKRPPNTELPHAAAAPSLPPPLPKWDHKRSPVSVLHNQETHLPVNQPPDVRKLKAVAPNETKPAASSSLLESITSHDKTTLKKPTMLNRSPAVQEPDDRDSMLAQIRMQSFCLRRTDTIARPSLFLPRTTTNIKVAAILEKANAIRQAFAGSDDGNDDEENWSDN